MWPNDRRYKVLLTIAIFVIGIAALVKGADFFVGSAAGIARAFNVPSLIIGLTIVALGTSAPELAVSVTAAVQGSNELAISNVIGSNLLNLMVVLGICAMIKPIPVETDVLKRDFPFSIAITVLLLAVTCSAIIFRGRPRQYSADQQVGTATHLDGLLLILLLIIYIGVLIYSARRNAPEEKEEAPADRTGIWRSVLLLLLGIAMILAGGEAVVYSAKEMAHALGMSETLIGLTVVAVGTSLPELVTSVVAALKGEVSMAVGNIIGSNVFNILFILGVSAAINPIGITAASAIDMLILICINLLMFFFALSNNRISRGEGAIMLILYIADMVFVFLR